MAQWDVDVNVVDAVELFDWLVNAQCVRGSRPQDGGLWVSGSAAPVAFDAGLRIVTLSDGRRYRLRKDTAAKVLGLHKAAEVFLAGLPPS